MPNPLPDAVRCLLFGSIAMTMEPSASAIESVIFREYAGSAGRLISLDPNIRPFMIPDREAYIRRFEGWLKAVHILKVSAEDLAYIYPDQDLPTALRRALSLGVRLVLLTHGSAGAVALLRKEDDEILRVKTAGRSVPVVDTIGAGDTFHGAFVAWLALYEHLAPDLVAALTEDELAQALAFANKAAALVCTRSGANPPTLAELEGV
jgi:fructokinase